MSGAYPDGWVAIVGGGRWARVIAASLLTLPSGSGRLSLHSPANSAGLREWWSKAGSPEHLEIHAAWPDFSATRRPRAVIVANAARDHARAAAMCLAAGIPTLVEKPLGLTAEEVAKLCRLSAQSGCVLAASRVFLFARYVDLFARSLRARGEIKRFAFRWLDPDDEVRSGEPKRFDPGVPVLLDVLPHIHSVLGVLLGRPLQVDGVALRRGGAEAELQVHAGAVHGSVLVGRQARDRQRRLRVEFADGDAVLDFTSEPGTVAVNGTAQNADPEWHSAPRPLAAMLSAFLSAAAGAPLDARLSALAALESCRLADSAMHSYRPQRTGWLMARRGAPFDDEIFYALNELAHESQGAAVPVRQAWDALNRLSAGEFREAISSREGWTLATRSF